MSNQQSKTVLITGASGGIGEALALCYAKHGHKLILVARNRERLEQVAEQCQQLSQQSALTVVADLAEKNAAYAIYHQVHEEKISIDVLINNAGIGSWGDFATLDLEEHERVIQINLLAVMQLTRLFVTDMVAQREGTVVSIASVYAYSPVPYQAIYAASKAFLLSFSGALSYELKDTGVTVSVICPGTTLTGFRKAIMAEEKPSSLSLSATTVAERAYTKIERDTLVHTPGLYNRIFVLITRLFPMKQLLSVVVFLVYKLRGYKRLTGKK